MVRGPQVARPMRVALVDSDEAFASAAASGLRFADGLEVVAIAPPPIDVVLTTEHPAATIVDHCPVHDKARSRTALYALVEAVRRRRQPTAAFADQD